MMDRAQGQDILQGLERRLDFDELDVEAPQLGGIASAQVGAQQIAALPAPNPSELVRLSAWRKLAVSGSTVTSTSRQAAGDLARAAPSFITSSSRLSCIADSSPSRFHSRFS